MRHPSFLLVRHGVTPANEKKVVRAWNDVPLDQPKARPVIERTAKQIAKLPLANPIYASSLKRAQQTADILGDALMLEVVPVGELRTWNLGDLEGTPSKDAEPLIAQFIRQPDAVVAGGERYRDFIRRWGSRFSRLAQEAMLHPEEIRVAVVHSSNIEAARDIAAGRIPENIAFGDTVKPGEAVLWRFVHGKWTEIPLAPERRERGE